ncbi:glucose-6-phosphate dehydrogenase [Halieaceae bacterium IMCC14734]|uniref:Glucose-6-phosphate 1-dehydrogenase n=1 Tax=Candidatus Litorirhabdus singularis TaxID=2518993 RepID=A0ABT3TCS2_9GAMM|nr:glucose-6-phosphate dehydrogenase [Candidatus Litorirhabdus singularis]MCX2980097.1 glucose-6-phosphate dehydrogenase [Candidatus Litorirhabdus singularis]
MTEQRQRHDLVIFGGNGDLALRKLLPALYYLEAANLLDQLEHIIGASRAEFNSPQYRDLVAEQLQKYLPDEDWDEEVWATFSARLEFVTVDANTASGYQALADFNLQRRPCIYYLATLPSLYGAICSNLQSSGVLTENSRVVLEKPLGQDLESCQEINSAVAEVFDELATFRIDHYLGKETVQNLIALRFGNPMFSHLWSHHYIDSVQITVAESLGVEGRGSYYAEVGALRDMVQNHLLQILCLVAMEPPNNLDADAIRDEKVKVLTSLQGMDKHRVREDTVRGQYAAGQMDGEAVPGFLDQEEYHDCALTETYVALKAEVVNWRWSGVPFYLRTGKRLAQQFSEIVIEFKPQVHSIFPYNSNEELRNQLVMRLQPEENVTLYAMSKQPGLGSGMSLQPTALDLTGKQKSIGRSNDAYERLLLDVINNDQTLFMRRDEVENAWRWADTIVESWEQNGKKPKLYKAGSMGPSSATSLIERDGRSWHE